MKLTVEDDAPDFEAIDQDGEMRKLDVNNHAEEIMEDVAEL